MSAATIFPSANPIFEERIRAIQHRLMLVQAALAAGEDDITVDQDQLLEAAWVATVEALDLLEPIRKHMDEFDSAWTAPKGGAQ